MDFTEFQTGKDDINRRLDKLIRVFIPDLPLSTLYQIIRKGLVKVNGKKSKPDYRIAGGDLISIADILLKSFQNSEKSPADDCKIEDLIVFENQNILILNKAAGINIHKAKKDEISLTELVEAYYNKNHSGQSLSFRPGPLHRLDKMTSGLVCFSMSLEGARWFSSLMEDHKIKKTYSATVEGIVTQKETWEDYIIKEDEKSEEFHTVNLIPGNTEELPLSAKKCITTIIPLNSFTQDGKEYTAVNFEIATGRQHQIRAQSSFHGHPLAGDTDYGGQAAGLSFDLCAFKLEFPPNDLEIPETIVLTNPFKK